MLFEKDGLHLEPKQSIIYLVNYTITFNILYLEESVMKQLTTKHLQTVGEQIRNARLRRNLTVKEVAERAGTTAVTVLNVEKGLPSVSVGKVAAVLEVLDLEEDILLIAAADPTGRDLQDEKLPKRASRPRTVKKPASIKAKKKVIAKPKTPN